MKTIFLDGKYLTVDPQIIEIFTPGVFKAKGVFETMLGKRGVVLDTALHLKRLRAGLKILGVKIPSINPSVLKEVLRRNHLSSGRVRLMVWQTDALSYAASKQTHVMAAAAKIPCLRKHRYTFSCCKQIYRVCLIKTNRAANNRLANLKSLDYELFAQAYAHARRQGFDEALLLNRSGAIFEASRANIFWIKDKVLYTPPLSSGCLNGITRQQVIKAASNLRSLKNFLKKRRFLASKKTDILFHAASNLKISVKEKNLTPEILKESDAAFLTNSLIGIKPIEVTTIRNISTD